MKLSSRILICFLILTPLFTKAQSNRTRQASCANGSQSKLYFTPYIGLGSSSYSFELNSTVMDTDSNFYETERGKLFTSIAGVNIMYNTGRVNIGGGGEWQGYFGNTDNGLFTNMQNLYVYKFYGRLEYAFYSDSFNDIGLKIEGGLIFPNKVTGEAANMGSTFNGGLYYNLILNSTSSLFICADYQHTNFTSNIGGAVSNHKLGDIRLTVGYRFWSRR